MRKTLVAIAAAAVMVLVTAGTAWADPAEGCASTCSVGAAGTGGESSDGNAEGFRLKGPSTGFPGSTFTNQGNEMGGHISVQGASEGSASGAFTPQGVLVGHFTGVSAIFFGLDGDCNGVCG
ncbi:MAG TPA: hypothetical protein VFY54_05965 [Rubrobacter sp.]|nr:hypothetical protein [Rubrobacter sp.]